MSSRDGLVLPFLLLLFSTSVFPQKHVVFGSSVKQQSFRRPDPLRNFKLYKGGYDITDKHYWASAAFTGIHGYAIAGVWMICGLGFGSYLILKNCTSNSSSHPEDPDSSYLTMFWLVVLLFSLAIIATFLVIVMNQSCRQNTYKLKETVLGAGGNTSKAIRKVAATMAQMQRLLIPYDPQTCTLLNVTSHHLQREWRMIRDFVQRTEHTTNKAIKISYNANLVVVTVNAACLVAAIVLLLLHWYPGFLILIVFCWIVVTLCWVLTGFDFFFHIFADDTCSAIEDFEQNPEENSLSSVLPCPQTTFSSRVLFDIGRAVHTSINELNSKITQLNGFHRLHEQKEESLGGRMICNPFSGPPDYDYAPERCPEGAIPIGDFPGILSRFTCYQADTGACARDGKPVPEAIYAMAWAYSNAIQDLINIFPHLQELIECSYVKEAFADVVLYQCRPFRSSTRKLWLSVLSLSVVMVALVIVWVGKAFQDKGRSFSPCSVVPAHSS
ncbi:hypothetical protein NMG60_11005983 [Bertholletia excelsa]